METNKSRIKPVPGDAVKDLVRGDYGVVYMGELGDLRVMWANIDRHGSAGRGSFETELETGNGWILLPRAQVLNIDVTRPNAYLLGHIGISGVAQVGD